MLASIFLVHSLTQTIMAAFGRLGRVLVMRQSTVVLALFALGIWCIIFVSLCVAVIVPGVWVLLMSTENWILREMTFLRVCNAWLYSGYMLCVSTFLWTNFSFFYDAADSNPEAFSPFGRMEKCAQSMLLVAVLLSAVHTGKPGSPFYELHLAELRDDGRAFSPLSAAFFRPPLRS